MGSLTITDSQHGTRQVQVSLTQPEIALLRDFAHYAQQLAECQYVREKPQAKLRLRFSRSQPMRVFPTLPSRDACDSFLFRLRPFVLKNERTYFLSVCSLLGRSIPDPGLHALLKSYRDQWAARGFRSMLHIADNFGPLSTDNALMDYLNAYEYHREEVKRHRLQATHDAMGEQGIRAYYFQLLAEKAAAVINIAALCGCVVGDVHEFKINFERSTRGAS